MKENMFEHSFIHQFRIAKPFILAVKRHTPVSMESSIEYFISQINKICVNLEERDEVPPWVVDRQDYRSKSEIMLAISLFEAIDFLRLKEIEGFCHNEFIGMFYNALSEFGNSRGWAMGALNIQFTKATGINLVNALSEEVHPKYLGDIDYN